MFFSFFDITLGHEKLLLITWVRVFCVALLPIMSFVFSFTSGTFLRIIITVPLNHTYLLTLNLVSAKDASEPYNFYFSQRDFRLKEKERKHKDNEDIKKLCIEAIELKTKQTVSTHVCCWSGWIGHFFIIKTLTTIWNMRVSPKKKQQPSVFRVKKNDISFAREHDTCNYARHNHEFLLELNAHIFLFLHGFHSPNPFEANIFKHILIKIHPNHQFETL